MPGYKETITLCLDQRDWERLASFIWEKVIILESLNTEDASDRAMDLERAYKEIEDACDKYWR